MQKVWLLYIALLNTVPLFGQQPDPPVIKKVSVDPFTDSVTIRWEKKPTHHPFSGYIIYDFKITKGVPGGQKVMCINDTNMTNITFKYDTVISRPVKFVMVAFKGVCDSAKYSMLGNMHRTIYTSLNYDSCNSEITINWTKYQGWGDSLRYKIFQVKGTITDSIAYNLPPNDSSYLISNIQGKQNYCYYVEADHINGMSVTSNMICRQTFLMSLPDYIQADQAVFLSNNLVELKFTLDSSSQTRNYQLTGSDSPDGTFTAIKQFYNVQSNSLVYMDTLKNLAPKYYRLEALNSCNIGVKYSNLATAMVPIASVSTNEITLAWNAYLDWPPQGVQEYAIYRSIGDGGFQPLASQSGTLPTEYTDNVASLVGQQLSGNLCYYIKAVPKTNITGNKDTSKSATVCVDITANVFIPNAFTPNGDGQNDEFKPSFAFLPSNYILTIFNRIGFKIFETSDPMKGWDGKLANNEKAAEGEYVYFIKFTSGSGKTVEKKGNFSLIYP